LSLPLECGLHVGTTTPSLLNVLFCKKTSISYPRGGSRNWKGRGLTVDLLEQLNHDPRKGWGKGRLAWVSKWQGLDWGRRGTGQRKTSIILS
jgi:hypothetical protein